MRSPSPLELMALAIAQRAVKSLFSVSNVELIWSVPEQRYAVGIDFDYRIGNRIPNDYFGVPVKFTNPIPGAVLKRGATILYGMPELIPQRGASSIGYPSMNVTGNGVDYTVMGYLPKNTVSGAVAPLCKPLRKPRLTPVTTSGFCFPDYRNQSNPWNMSAPYVYYDAGC